MNYVAAAAGVVGFFIAYCVTAIFLREVLPPTWWLDFKHRDTWAMPVMGTIPLLAGLVGGAACSWLFGSLSLTINSG
jgi:hypothetical protein